MNILDAVGISLPCRSCGDNYQVPLRDVLLSHKMLHQSCQGFPETECPPAFQSRLFERKDIEELQRAWSQLENKAATDGGELVLMGAHDPVGAQSGPAQRDGNATQRPQRPQANAPITTVHGEHTLESPRRTTKKREKNKLQKVRAQRP